MCACVRMRLNLGRARWAIAHWIYSALGEKTKNLDLTINCIVCVNNRCQHVQTKPTSKYKRIN